MESPYESSPQQKQYRFILNTAKNEDAELVQIIGSLKSRRSFSRGIRVGLRLFWSLREGRTDVLVGEFPWIAERLTAPLDELQAQLNRIEAKMQLAAPAVASAPRLAAPKMQALEPEIPELVIQEAQSDENPTFNMILSTLSIGGKAEHIPREILEYGIKKGRVSASLLESLSKKSPNTDPKPLLGVDQVLTAPNFDDDQLDDLLNF